MTIPAGADKALNKTQHASWWKLPFHWSEISQPNEKNLKNL
jgi:hypothetical protein